jgi:VWFA-related protein
MRAALLRRIELTAILFLATTLAATAQTGPAPHTTTLSVRTRLVVLDFVAVDREGKPVFDLKRDEVKVLEDGKPRPIVSFDFAVAPTATPSAHTDHADAAVHASAHAIHPARPSLTLLVVDQMNTHFADSSFAARQVADFLSSQPAQLEQPAVLLALTDSGLQVMHAATSDRQALLAAMKAGPVKYPWKLETHNSAGAGVLERLETSVQALVELTEAYGPLAGRKDVVWIGAGFPTIDPDELGGAERDIIRDSLRHVTNALMEAHMTVSVVDPTTLAPGMTEIVDAAEQMFFTATGGAQAPDVRFFDPSEDFDGLAAVTGGRVIRGRNDIGAQIGNAIDADRLPYGLSYRPADDYEGSPRFRKLELVSLRPGVKILSRQGYFAGKSVNTASTPATTIDLAAAETTSLPLNGISVQVREIAHDADETHRYMIRVPADDLAWTTSDNGSRDASVYVAAIALSHDHHVLHEVVHPMLAHAIAGAEQRPDGRFAEFTIATGPIPKNGTMRFLVRDSNSGHIGAADLK